MQEAQETRVCSLVWEDPLEKETVTHSSILTVPWGCKELDVTEDAQRKKAKIVFLLKV